MAMKWFSSSTLSWLLFEKQEENRCLPDQTETFKMTLYINISQFIFAIKGNDT